MAFGWQTTAERLKALGADWTLRTVEGGRPFVTDGGNYTLDCRFQTVPPAIDLQRQLDQTIGVVDHGLFLGMTSQVIIGAANGVSVLRRES